MFPEAAHPAPPQVADLGGGVLTAPKIVPIFFAGDDPRVRAQVEDLAGQLGSSAYWKAIASEYGVGPIELQPTIVTSDAPPTTDTALASWLAGHFTGTDGWPAASDPQAITRLRATTNPELVLSSMRNRVPVAQSWGLVGD